MTLTDQYKVNGYPTMVFINSEGQEIDRIIGYRPPDEFVVELNRIHKNINTIDDLLKRTEENPTDFDLWKKLAEKYDERGTLLNAQDVWVKIGEIEGEHGKLVEYKLAFYNSRINESPTELETFIQTHPDTEFLSEAYHTIIRIHRRNKVKYKEAQTYSDYISALEKQGKNTAYSLNGYAWRMTELELNLEDALDNIRLARLKIEDNDPQAIAQIMDTEAEVLWKLGRPDEAVEIIEECIALQPTDDYYQKQKAKFLSTISESNQM